MTILSDNTPANNDASGPDDFHAGNGELIAVPVGVVAGTTQHNNAGPPGPDETDEPRQPAASVSMVGFPLIVELAGQLRQIAPVQLQSEEYRGQLGDELRNAGGQAVFDLRHLLDWADGDRWAVLAFITGLGSGHTVRVGETETESLFVAVLAAMVGDDNVDRCRRGVQAAIEAAALVHGHPQAVPPACNHILRRLTELGVAGYNRQDLKRQVQRLSSGSQTDTDVEPEEAVAVRDVLPDAPVNDDVVLPEGWMLGAEGIAKATTEDAAVIIAAPMVITRRFTEVDGDAEHLGVSWPRDGRWHEQIEPRASVMDTRAVLKLATYGAPVNGINAKDVVQFLADFESYNLEALPRSTVTQQLGWQGADGRHGFLWGRELIRAAAPTASSMTSDAIQEDPEVTFRGADEGDDQLADGYRQAGSFEGWQRAVEPLGCCPRVKLAFYAALAPPLLRILQAPNFTVSLSGATSQGKTITQRVAASCWGCPDERSPGAVLATWDATRVFIERACEAQNDLPLLLDDTKRAREPKCIAQTLYDVSAGRGRGRGSLEGIRGIGTFRTVMISSGEAPITSFSQDGGTRPRVLELWGSPFGRADAQTAQLVSGLNEGILDNFGHIGPRFVQFLTENRDHWPSWREHYRRLRNRYEQRAGNNSAAARMASHFAVLRMAAILGHMAVEMPWGYRDVVTELWPELTAEAPEADQAAAALRYVLSWAHGHRDQFFGAGAAGQAPSGGWAGRWDGGGGPGGNQWEYLGLLPHIVDQILKEGGFEPVPIRRLWRDRQWLRLTPDKQLYRTRMGNENTYFVAIKREVIEVFEEPDQVDASGHPFPRLVEADRRRGA